MGANSSAELTPSVALDHPGVPELFAVLAYGEISAFYRLVEEAQLSPSLRGKVAVAKMAAAEMNHFKTVERALSDRGVDVFLAGDDDPGAAFALRAQLLGNSLQAEHELRIGTDELPHLIHEKDHLVIGGPGGKVVVDELGKAFDVDAKFNVGCD